MEQRQPPAVLLDQREGRAADLVVRRRRVRSASPRTNAVFPAPSSPCSSTTSPGPSESASARAGVHASRVSDSLSRRSSRVHRSWTRVRRSRAVSSSTASPRCAHDVAGRHRHLADRRPPRGRRPRRAGRRPAGTPPSASSPCASHAATIPVSTSPLPPVAMPGIAGGLMKTRPRARRSASGALQDDVHAVRPSRSRGRPSMRLRCTSAASSQRAAPSRPGAA